MKKVCILQNGLARGGTDTFVVNLCKGLDKSKFDITVINSAPDKNNCYVREPEVLAAGVRIYHPYPFVYSKLRYFWQLYKFLKKEKFDVFQTNIDLFNGPNLLVAQLAGVPLRCCHSHNSNQPIQLVKGNTLAVRAYQVMMRWMCWSFSNRRCGCSKLAMEFIFKGKDWHKGSYPKIINNGIDLDLFKKSIDVEKKKRSLGLTAKYHLITVGHIKPQKNPLFIAHLFADLCNAKNDCDLIWVGDGVLKKEVQDILKAEGIESRVHFFDNRSDVSEILRCADCFILPSAFEGLGIVAIEAQASGLPCLLSDKVPEEVDCGTVDFLPIDRGTNIWADAITKVIERKKIYKLNIEKLNQFSIENMVSQMEELFNS